MTMGVTSIPGVTPKNLEKFNLPDLRPVPLVQSASPEELPFARLFL